MKLKKILSVLTAITMLIGIFTIPPVASADDTDSLTTLENIEVTPIVQEGTSKDGFEVWNPGKRDDGNTSPAADAKYGTVDGENVFIVWRYRNDMPNPLITAQVQIDDTIYNTVIDMSYCNNAYGGFCTSQNTTQKLKIETGVECKNLTNFFFSNHGCKTVDIPTNIVKDLNFASNLNWAYYNEDISDFVAYTPKTEITNYTQDRIVLHGANTSVHTISFYNSVNDKNSSQYTKKNICAWFYLNVDPNGGTFQGTSNVYSYGQINGNKTITDIPTNGEYIFTGWDYTAEWHDDSNGNTIKTATLKANWAEPHTHEYSSEITTEPTCTEQGIRTYTCNICNYKYTEPIEALGHDFNEEDTCIRCGINLQAKIGDTKYATLQDAINAANNGDTIVLINDIYTTSTYQISGKTLTIDLNGKTVTGKCSGSVLSAYYSDITIKDTVGGGVVEQTNGGYGRAVFASYSTVSVGGGKYISNGQYGAIHASNSSNVYVSNATLEGDGGNVAVIDSNSYGVFTDITLNALYNSYHGAYSDGIWVQSAKLEIESGTYNGSVISYRSGSDIIIKSGTFNSDTDTYNGGSMTISGGTFSNDIKDYVAGGYYQKDNGDGTYTVLPAESKVIETAKTTGAEIKLDNLEKNTAVNPKEDATYKVVVSTASAEDSAAVKQKIEESKESDNPDNNSEKAIFDISVVKVDSNGVETDLGGTEPHSVTNQLVTITLGETPKADTVRVYHVVGGATEEINAEVHELSVNGNKVSFIAPSFSTYAVTYDVDRTVAVPITDKVGVVFSPVSAYSNQYYITLKALDENKQLYRFMSTDLVFKNNCSTADYEITPAARMNVTLAKVSDDGTSREYHFEMDGLNASSATGEGITIGTITFEGRGTLDFSVDTSEDIKNEIGHSINIVNTAETENNIVAHYTLDGGTLIVNDDVDSNYISSLADDESGKITDEIKIAEKTLTVNVTFNNSILDNTKAYQDMKAVISGGDLPADITFEFGDDANNLTDNVYTFTQKLTQNVSYTVTVKGAGYRTARYTVRMTADKTLNFWNNVMDTAQVVEVNKPDSVVKTNFLAGDIVKDNDINIYDLSAVVSYFGTSNNVNAESAYAKYDLNRDGKIDSKDVAYVLVSWGN